MVDVKIGTYVLYIIFIKKLFAGNGSILIQHSGQPLQQGQVQQGQQVQQQGQQGLNHQTQQNLQHSQIQVSTL